MKCRQKHKELILKIHTKQICIVFLSIFIGANCAAKKTLKKTKSESQKETPTESIQTLPETSNVNSDVSIKNPTINDLFLRLTYLEELLNSYQAQSLALIQHLFLVRKFY